MLDKAAKDRRYAIQDAVGKPGTRSNDAESRRDRTEGGLKPDRGPPGHSRPAFQCRRGPGEDVRVTRSPNSARTVGRVIDLIVK
jgi:hypothetical protein